MVAVNNYRATTQLLTAADMLPAEKAAQAVGDRCAWRRGRHPRAAGRVHPHREGAAPLKPHVNSNWKIVGNNWKALPITRGCAFWEGKLAHLNENADTPLPGKAITTADIAKFKNSFLQKGLSVLGRSPFLCENRADFQPFPGNWLKKQYHSAAFRGTMKLYSSRCCGQMGQAARPGAERKPEKTMQETTICSHCSSAGRRRHCRRAALGAGLSP